MVVRGKASAVTKLDIFALLSQFAPPATDMNSLSPQRISLDWEAQIFLHAASKAGALVMVLGFLSSCNRPDDHQTEACDLMPNPGPCFAAIPKFYFDEEAQECIEFTWGGCGGVVPFDTLEECQECECD